MSCQLAPRLLEGEDSKFFLVQEPVQRGNTRDFSKSQRLYSGPEPVLRREGSKFCTSAKAYIEEGDLGIFPSPRAYVVESISSYFPHVPSYSSIFSSYFRHTPSENFPRIGMGFCLSWKNQFLKGFKFLIRSYGTEARSKTIVKILNFSFFAVPGPGLSSGVKPFFVAANVLVLLW